MTDNPISVALKMIPYGFYTLGTKHEGQENMMVLNWLTQASFEPQLIAVAIQKSSFSYGLIEKSGMFTINILHSKDQSAISAFTKSRAKNPDKLKDAALSAGPKSGAPVLDAAAAFLECRVVKKVDTGGDHDIFVAEVTHAEVRETGDANQTLNLPDMGWSYAG